jgi:hypothetical protein
MTRTYAVAALVLTATLVSASGAAAKHRDDGRRSIVVERADSSGRSPMQHALGVRERAVHTGLAARSRSESLIHTGRTGVWLALLVGALMALGVFLVRGSSVRPFLVARDPTNPKGERDVR